MRLVGQLGRVRSLVVDDAEPAVFVAVDPVDLPDECERLAVEHKRVLDRFPVGFNVVNPPPLRHQLGLPLGDRLQAVSELLGLEPDRRPGGHPVAQAHLVVQRRAEVPVQHLGIGLMPQRLIAEGAQRRVRDRPERPAV